MMRRLRLIEILLTLFVLSTRADVITLRTGQTVRGDILMQNEQVIIIQNSQGQRFQYPRTDVTKVESEELKVESDESRVESREQTGKKKVSLDIELSGGGMSSPHVSNGGAFGADLIAGSHHIGDRHILVGGGIGWHSYFGNGTYSFIPLQVALRVPLIEGKHAPQIGVGIGYGFSVNKNASHGLYAGFDFGYRYQINRKNALFIGVYLNFQQTQWNATETLTAADGQEASYTVHSGSNLLGYGLKFAVLL